MEDKEAGWRPPSTPRSGSRLEGAEFIAQKRGAFELEGLGGLEHFAFDDLGSAGGVGGRGEGGGLAAGGGFGDGGRAGGEVFVNLAADGSGGDVVRGVVGLLAGAVVLGDGEELPDGGGGVLGVEDDLGFGISGAAAGGLNEGGGGAQET